MGHRVHRRGIIGIGAGAALLLASAPLCAADDDDPSARTRLDTRGIIGAAFAQDDDDDDGAPSPYDFTDLDLEQLMQVQVTSPTGRAQPLLDVPAAVTVITGEDVRRTGHRSIAEALRLVPGFNVGRIGPSIWAIGSRGFQDRFANDLQVLIDGRIVYDPLFSGVFWNVQDVVLEDLDRIEAIRGPGATLWGANAVNGVVSVTTKSSRETQGLYLTGGGDNLEQGFGAARYGGRLGGDGWYRVWAKYDNHAAYPLLGSDEEVSDWDFWHGGFRADWEIDDETALTFDAAAYTTGRISEHVRVPVPGHFTFVNQNLDERFNGGHALLRAARERSATSGWSVQAYYDRALTRGGRPGFEVRRDTVDFDYRQYEALGEGERHVLMWGLGYRHTSDRTDNAPTLHLLPRSRSLDTFSAFIQDTITIVPDRLFLMAGSKFEHNDHTGFEYQPTARLSWTPAPQRTIWAAVSRAVRTPSRSADDLLLTTAYADTGLLGGGAPSGTFVPLQVTGDDGVEAERLIAWEAGHRFRATERLTVDLATFYNDYEDLITFSLPSSTFGNRGAAQSWGGEVAASWQVADSWRLAGSYSLLQMDIDSPDGTAEERESPQQQFQVRSFIDLTDELELNSALYWVDEVADERAGDYFRLDVGMTWRPSPNLEVALWGQNLLDDRHLEFGGDIFQALPKEVERSFFVQVSLRF